MVHPMRQWSQNTLFQVSQTYKDPCRLDGEHLLPFTLAWSDHPPPISYSSHTILCKYIQWSYLRGFNQWVPCESLNTYHSFCTYWHLQSSESYSLSVRTHLSLIIFNKKSWLFLWCRKGKWNEYLNAVETRPKKCMPKFLCIPSSQFDDFKEQREVCQFLGFTNYYQHFIKGFSGIAKPLIFLIGKEQ